MRSAIMHIRAAMVAALVLQVCPATAATFQSLTDGFGVVVFGGYEGRYSDVEHGLSAGGDVRLGGYSVGQEGGAGIVAGGNVVFSNGSVGPGGSGSIRAAGSVSGGATAAVVADGDHSALSETAVRQVGLETLSDRLGQLEANGRATLRYGTLLLEGENHGLNVFAVDVAMLDGSSTIDIITPLGSTNLIRVLGEDIRFDGRGGQIMFGGQAGVVDGPFNAMTLWHMPEATSLSLGGSRAPQGSILAPLAEVVGGFGQMNGVLVALAFQGHTQINRPVFRGDLPDFSEPPAHVFLPGGGVLAVSAFGGFFAWAGMVGQRRKQAVKQSVI